MTLWISSRPRVELSVFEAWLRGDDARVLAQAQAADIGQYGFEIVYDSVRDQYDTVEALEPFLQQPRLLVAQDIVPLDRKVMDELLSKYYSYDGILLRQVLSKKLTRNYLDEMEGVDQVPLKSRRRQFDNLKRITKAVLDVPGRTGDNIKQQFLLEDRLAKDYAAMVFISDNRLNTDKRVLASVPLQILLNCAKEFMEHWTTGAENGGTDQDLDKQFPQDLRELRYALASKDVTDWLHTMVAEHMGPGGQEQVSAGQAIINATITIGAGLSYSRDWRDIFEDLVERVAAPLAELRWLPNEFGQLLQHIAANGAVLALTDEMRVIFKRAFPRYIDVVIRVVHILMAST